MIFIFEIGNKVAAAAYLTHVFSGLLLEPWVGMKSCKNKPVKFIGRRCSDS